MITGGCLCGKVRYVLASEPVAARVCWCRLCQYLGAGTGTANLTVAAADLSITGAVGDYSSVADSGSVMHRHFCPTCGTPIGGFAESRAHFYVLRIGTLNEPGGMTPGATIWTASAPHWAVIDPDLPSFPGQPPPAA